MSHNKSKPKVVFSATDAKYLNIRGEKVKENPLTFRDGGLLMRLKKFLFEKAINPIWTSHGNGSFGGLFHERDALRVIAWLQEQGAEYET